MSQKLHLLVELINKNSIDDFFLDSYKFCEVMGPAQMLDKILFWAGGVKYLAVSFLFKIPYMPI